MNGGERVVCLWRGRDDPLKFSLYFCLAQGYNAVNGNLLREMVWFRSYSLLQHRLGSLLDCLKTLHVIA